MYVIEKDESEENNMGLDMYFKLKRCTYSNKFHADAEFRGYPKEMSELYDSIMEYDTAFCEEAYGVGYFRKFNALHKYMCDLDGGKDECQEIFVSWEEVDELINILSEIYKDHSKAKILLPTCDGFMFGGLEYNEWYFENVERALDLFKKLKKFQEENQRQLMDYEGNPCTNDDGSPYMYCEWDLIYRASW